MINNIITDIGTIIEHLQSVPFDVNRTQLYTAAELYHGYQPEQPETFGHCHDTQIYNHFIATGKQTTDLRESLARTLHDHSIYLALGHFFERHHYLHCIGVMGGHALLRTDAMYRQIVSLSKQLTEQGYCILSGGGPGAMEATHLGAWMAGYTDADVTEALRTLSVAPSFKDPQWLCSAFAVMHRYPQSRYESLGIPTWLYGHEPSTPFATHIAKFFDNSLRENHILTLPFGGIIYTPGSAGTMQEIFQDAVQNHYLSYGISSPMIFLGTRFWTEEIPLYPFLQTLSSKGKYQNLSLTLTDDPAVVIQTLQTFQERKDSLKGLRV